MADEPNYQLIQCGDHKWAPWCICCEHLMDAAMKKEQATAVAMESDFPEVDYDWVCSDCYDIIEESGTKTLVDRKLVHAVCIHCMREILENCEQIIPEGDDES